MTNLNITIEDPYMYILVLVRLTAMVIFNPVFSSGRISPFLKTGILAGAAVILTPLVPVTEAPLSLDFDLFLAVIRETAAGWLLGYVFNIYYYFLVFAGDVMDMQFGFSMDRVLDPGSGISTSVNGKFLEIIFAAYIFITDTHLVLIKTVVSSYDLIPAGAFGINTKAALLFGTELFSSVFVTAIRILFPFLVLGFVMETGMGILMKLIPQLNIFAVNMQLKVLLSLVLLFLMAVPVTSFTENYLLRMTDSMQDALRALAG